MDKNAPRIGRAEVGPFVSALIPTFNNERSIIPLLDSLLAQGVQVDEVIIVDDCSTDSTAELARKHSLAPTVVKLEKNCGPSVARNAGVQATYNVPNSVVLFLDSDVVIPRDTVERVKSVFCDASVSAVNGIMAPPPLNPSLATWYKCLVEHAWGHFPTQWDNTSTCFNTRIGALRRESFLDIGGFDIRYRKPCVEDHEFGQRYSAAYTILHDRLLQAQHHFSGFVKTHKNYWKRTAELLELLWSTSTSRTDKGGASVSSGLEYLLGAVMWGTVLVSSLLGPLPSGLALTLFVGASWKSLRYCQKHKGWLFYCYALALHSMYSATVTLSGALAAARQLLNFGRINARP